MAGYIFNLNSNEALIKCIESGVYSTRLSPPVNMNWKAHHEGTFADYFTMKEGDNVYFFIKRKIYGVGEITKLCDLAISMNYPNADIPTNYAYEEIKNEALLNNNPDNLNNRCICFFKPSPIFFSKGVDMDDVLCSNPSSFKMLRAFWKLSFVKLPEDENKALRDIILVRNEENFLLTQNHFRFSDAFHRELELKLLNSSKYSFNHKNVLKYAKKGTAIKHEMAIEASLLAILAKHKDTLFGRWDYLSHQVIASPFKAIDYMDKMDVFGYRYIDGFDTISKYLCVEIKRDKARPEDVEQVMKYVDWINNEYAYGNYEMIEAFLVAYKIPNEVVQYRNRIGQRNYMQGLRPTISKTWTNLMLVEYKYKIDIQDLEFSIID